MLSDRAIELIETTFSDYMIGKINEKTFLNKLTTALDNLPFNSKKEFNVSMDKAKGMRREFFGFNVFPSIDKLEVTCSMIANEDAKFTDIVKRWRSIDSWEIVIDSMLFDRTFIAFNPKELTAMLLHEIGHVTQSDEPIEQFYRAYLEAKSRMKAADKISKRALYMLYTIPLAVACTSRRWVNDKNELNLEISADKSLIETGYADCLVSAFDKIIKAAGSIDVTSNMNYKKIESNVEWANSNIVDVVKRRDKLKDALYYKAIQSNSGYIQALCTQILDTLGVRMRERYTGYVAESCMLPELIEGKITLEQYVPVFDNKIYGAIEAKIIRDQSRYVIATEAFFNKRKNAKVDLPDEYDLDRIFVAIDDIQNNYDKVYVLDMIYENIEKLNNFEEAIAMDEYKAKKWAPKIQELRTRLDTLRKTVLNKNIAKKEYKVFVKVPEGYEG